jgi:hypothetical protein
MSRNLVQFSRHFANNKPNTEPIRLRVSWFVHLDTLRSTH